MKGRILPLLLVFIYYQLPAQFVARDISFNSNKPTTDGNVRSMALFSDNRVAIAGEFYSYNSQPFYSVAVLQPNGWIDSSFNYPVLDDRVDAIAVQSWDNKLIIAGSFTQVNGYSLNRVARLNTDGSVDLSFQPGTGVTGAYDGDCRIYTIVIRDDADPGSRRIILGGNFEFYNGTRVGNRGSVVQIFPDGKRDASFNPMVSDGPVYAMTLDKHGRLIIGGEFWTIGTNDNKRIARLQKDGSFDPTFTHNGWGPYSSVTAVYVTSDEKIMAGGYFDRYNGIFTRGIARFLDDGKLDTSFHSTIGFQAGSSSYSWYTEARCFLEMDSGKILVGGNFRKYNGVNCSRNIIRLNYDGSADTAFKLGTGFNETVMGLYYHNLFPGDLRILANGHFNRYNNEFQGGVIRLIPSWALASSSIQIAAKRLDHSILVKWTANEIQSNDKFVIERSNDGKQFHSLTEIELPGLSNPLQRNFAYTDASAGTGQYFYRIVQFRQGLPVTQSPVVEIAQRLKAPPFSLTTYPNPATNILSVQAYVPSDQSIVLRLVNTSGNLLDQKSYRAETGMNTFRLDISLWPRGTYYLVAINPNGQSVTRVVQFQ